MITQEWSGRNFFNDKTINESVFAQLIVTLFRRTTNTNTKDGYNLDMCLVQCPICDRDENPPKKNGGKFELNLQSKRRETYLRYVITLTNTTANHMITEKKKNVRRKTNTSSTHTPINLILRFSSIKMALYNKL